MKRYELIIAGILISLSTVMKIGSFVALCHTPQHIEETAHDVHLCVDKKEQTSHQPLG